MGLKAYKEVICVMAGPKKGATMGGGTTAAVSRGCYEVC